MSSRQPYRGASRRIQKLAGSLACLPKLAGIVCLAFFAVAGCTRSVAPSGPAGTKTGAVRRPASEPLRKDDRVGRKLFERADEAIAFRHRFRTAKQEQFRLNNAFAGGGVAIGDYDGDGRPDVCLTSPGTGPRLFRNIGNLRFEDVSKSTGILRPGVWASGVSFADIDNDGDLDLYVCALNEPNLLFINEKGRFREAAASAGLDFRGASVMMAFADYDRDGDLDAYLLTNSPSQQTDLNIRLTRRDGKWHIPDKYAERAAVLTLPNGTPRLIEAGQRDHLYRNNGDGTFTDVSAGVGLKGNDFGLAAVWWDFDDDGFPDLYVANDFYGADQLWRNRQDGTFENVTHKALPHTPWFSMGADSADLNNDGLLDFMGSDMLGTTHFKQKMSMGNMGGPNSDSWFLTYPEPRQYMRNAVYLNTGTTRFMEVAYLTGLAGSDWTWSVKLADFDCDGWNDVYLTNGMTRDWYNSDLRKRATQLKDRQKVLDLFLNSKPLRQRNLAFHNKGELRFAPSAKEWGLDDDGISFGAGVGDLDGDGDLDIVVNNFDASATVYRNTASSVAHRTVIGLVGRTSNRFGIGARVTIQTASGRQTRFISLSRGFMSADQPVAHFGLGKDSLIETLEIRWPSGIIQTLHNVPANRRLTYVEPQQSPSAHHDKAAHDKAAHDKAAHDKAAHDKAAHDKAGHDKAGHDKAGHDKAGHDKAAHDKAAHDKVPVDRGHGSRPRPHFVEAKQPFLSAHQERPFNDYQRQPLLPYQLSQLGPGLAWGDVDGDGDDDLAVSGAAGQPTSLYRNNQGRLQFETVFAFFQHKDHEDMGLVFVDADSDGDLDLFVVSGGVECVAGDARLRDRLYLNDGKGDFTFAADAVPKLLDSGGPVAAADFDRDGDVDLFVGGRTVPGKYPLTPQSRILKNENGRFTDVTDTVSSTLRKCGMVTGAVWTDVNDDGWIDLVVAVEWGPIRVFRNQAGRLEQISDPKNVAQNGWWNGVVAGDIDRDGDMDLVVTNCGLNTKYHASAKHPARLYYGDMDGTGKPHLVEAEESGSHTFPIRGRSCSTRAMPTLGQRFGTFRSFASASLQEIYSKSRLSKAQVWNAHLLESAVLLNDGSGRFQLVALPRMAQVSQAFGAVIADFDIDGHPDICLAQNFFGPQPETGRYDGGLGCLLRGTKTRHRWVYWKPTLSGFVVPDDARSLAIADTNGDGRPDLAVGINNKKPRIFQNGSPRAAMSIRLQGRTGNPAAVGARITVKSDPMLVHEITAGAGYLSQSAPVMFLPVECLPGKGKRPFQVSVRWPDGAVTDHTLRQQPVIVLKRGD